MPEWLIRASTGTVLVLVCCFAYFFLAPWMLALFIAVIGAYAIIAEYIPLCRTYMYAACLSPLIIVPFFILVWWALNYATRHLLALTMIGAASADTGAYVFGNLCGQHKLTPSISPNKTWEGFFGGWLTTIITLIFLSGTYGSGMVWTYAQGFPLFFCIIHGFGIAIFGLLGDLYISVLKRKAGIKDTGHVLPGHGGLLDRLDSVLAITLYIWLWWPRCG